MPGLLVFLIAAAQSAGGQAELTAVNVTGETVVAAYVLERAYQASPRSVNLLNAPLAAGDSARIAAGAESCVLLVEDELGNDYLYGLPEQAQNGVIHLSMRGLSLASLHSGSGTHPLHVVNLLTDLRLDRATLDSGVSDLLEGRVLFTGQTLTIWTTPGTHSLELTDQLGGRIGLDDVVVPDTGYSLRVTDSLLRRRDPVAVYGRGDAVIEIQSRITASALTWLAAMPSGEVPEELPLPRPLDASERVLLRVPAGSYDLRARDADGASYFINGIQAGRDTLAWFVSNRYMRFDYGFPHHGDRR